MLRNLRSRTVEYNMNDNDRDVILTDDDMELTDIELNQRNPRNLEWRRAPEDQIESDSSGKERDEFEDNITTVNNGARDEDEHVLRNYSKARNKKATRNGKQATFDLRGSAPSINLFEDVGAENFDELEFDLHRRSARGSNASGRNPDIRNARPFDVSQQELEFGFQKRKKKIARKQNVNSDDNDDDRETCNDVAQSFRRNVNRPIEKNMQSRKEGTYEPTSQNSGDNTRFTTSSRNPRLRSNSALETGVGLRRLNDPENRLGTSSHKSESKACYVKPPKYDGKSCIESHLTQFRIAATRNRWNEGDKVDFLKMSLTGEANNILRDITDDITYEELETKLKQRYGSLDQVEAYRVQLKARRRKKNETLSELMMDIRRLFSLAYPGPSNYMTDLAAKDSFVDALDDKELMIRVMEREPKNLEEAFKIAERMELYSKRIDVTDRTENETRTRGKVRAATAKEDGNIKLLMENQKAMQHQITSLIQLMQQQNKSSQQVVENQKRADAKTETTTKSNDRPVINCFGCGKEGHIKPRCPERSNGNFGFNKRRTYNEPRSPPTNGEENNETSSVRKIGQTLYVKMRIGEKTHNCLIDTGSEVNLIPHADVQEHMVAPSSKVLEAANGTKIGVLGEINVEVKVAGSSIPTKFIVSDQLGEIIIGVQWLQDNKCSIWFPQSIMTIGDIKVPLLKKVTNNRCNRIILQEDIEIPPSSEVNVSGKIVYKDVNSLKTTTWMTSPNECKNGVYVASVLLPNKNKNVPVRVVNTNEEAQVMERGMQLTTIQEVELIEEVDEDRDQECDRKRNKHIEELIEQVDVSVTAEYKTQLKDLLTEYKDIISSDELDLGRTELVEHRIDTGDARPVRQTLRRSPAAYAHIIDEQLETLMKQGIIEPTNSEWSSNVVLVKKKDQSWRFCVDFRKINEVSTKDAYPLPRIDSCIDALSNSAWFSTLDLRSGFFQVKISEKDSPKTTFITRSGAYKFLVMPQGLCNSTATFQRLMNIVMAGLNFNSCLVYLDDVIIFAPTLEIHMNRLRNVFERFRSAKLKIRADKCYLLQREVAFLGYRINKDGVSTDKKK